MQTFNSVFQRELVKLVEEEIANEIAKLETNPFTEDGLGGLRYIQGRIAALRNIGTLLAEAAIRADQNNR